MGLEAVAVIFESQLDSLDLIYTVQAFANLFRVLRVHVAAVAAVIQ